MALDDPVVEAEELEAVLLPLVVEEARVVWVVVLLAEVTVVTAAAPAKAN